MSAGQRHGLAASAATLAVAIGLWADHGVALSDGLLFLAYTLGFVFLPGYLAYLALSGRRGLGLREVVIGSALGYAISLAAFAITAALDVRALLPACAPVVAIAGLVALRRRRGQPSRTREGVPGSPMWTWAAGAIAIASLLLVAERFYEAMPLPAQGAPGFNPDSVWFVAIAAEAASSWPIQVPGLVGETLHYHYFAYLSEAGARNLTGIDQLVVNYRLSLVPMLLLALGGFLLLGRQLAGHAAGGVLAAGLFLLVGWLEPLPQAPGGFFANLYLSDSFLLGLAVFLPLLSELTAKLRSDPTARWPVIVILAAVASGSKGSILPVLASGLGIGLMWALWRRRDLIRPTAFALAITVVVLVASYITLYGSGGGERVELEPFASVEVTDQYLGVVDALGGSLSAEAAGYLIGTLLATVELLAPLVPGLILLALIRPMRSSPEVVLMVGIVFASLVPIHMTVAPGHSEYYFFGYGYAAAAVLSGAAIARAATVGPPLTGRELRFAIGGSIVVFAIAAWSDNPRLRLKSETPFDPARTTSAALTTSAPPMSESLFEALRWIRDNTSRDDVLAVSNQYSDAEHTIARACWYTAFAERRAMLECEYGGGRGFYPSLGALREDPSAHPFPDRFALNEGIFRRGSVVAADRAREEFGVTHLLVDRPRSPGLASMRRLLRLGDPRFENAEVTVIALTADRRQRPGVRPDDRRTRAGR